ncbi:hypothetical protein ABPG75_007694 [Micractinium tetrahymenae]
MTRWPVALALAACLLALAVTGAAEEVCSDVGVCQINTKLNDYCSAMNKDASTCDAEPTCYSATSPTAGQLCMARTACPGLSKSACEAAVWPKDNTTLACNYTTVTVCKQVASTNPSPSPIYSSPSPTPYPTTPIPADPCESSTDSCCPNASSWDECVLDTPAADSCSFWGGGCQQSYNNACYEQSDETSCASLGCSWVAFPAQNQTSPPPAQGPGSSYLPPWRLYPVPELPADYFTNTTGRWWSSPDSSGHGPFDVFTPPIADALLRANASYTVCSAISDFLRGATTDLASVCEKTWCGPDQAPLARLLGLLSESVYIPIDACDACQFVVQEGIPMLNTSGFDLPRFLVEMSSSSVLEQNCPPLLDGLLWVARHYDFLPNVGAPIASTVCPAAHALAAAMPDLLDPEDGLCPLLFGMGHGSPCPSVWPALLASAGSDPAAAVGQLCFTYLPSLFESSPSSSTSSQASYLAASAQSAPGYCMNAPHTAQCYSTQNSELCDSIPGCRWASTCRKEQCYPGDTWCQQRVAAAPTCRPLAAALLAAGNSSVPSVSVKQVCTDLGMCGANPADPLCAACKTAFSDFLSSAKYMQQYYGQGGQGFGDSLLSSCASTISRLAGMQATCGAVGQLNMTTLPTANVTAICAADSAALCQVGGPQGDGAAGEYPHPCNTLRPTPRTCARRDLAAAGAVGRTSSDLQGLCYSMAQYAGNSVWGLRQQVQWRWGCSPDSSCCLELPPGSFLARELGVAGITPPTAASCTNLPGCVSDTYCWPSWGHDECRGYANRASCSDNENCQWFSWGSGSEAGTCVDAVLNGKCRLAGEQGTCSAVADDQGVQLCQSSQASGLVEEAPGRGGQLAACHVDWAISCWDPTDACCLAPLDLFSPDAPETCANHSTPAAACAHSVRCITTADPCSAFMSQPTCELSPDCLWHRYPDASYPGWCTSARDSCSDYSNDADACTASPACRAVPRCARSYCHPDDQCCLTSSLAECRATPGCGASSWCALTSSPCWYAWDAAACANTTGCAWQASEGSPSGGWCTVATDPCSPYHSSPIGCAAVADSRGAPLCKYQSACYDACQSCKGCLEGVSDFAASVLPRLAGNTSAVAQAARDYCTKSGGDYWTCAQIFSVLAAHPEAASRPAALCKAAYQCSDDCASSLGLTLCSTTGYAGGAIPLAATPAGVCKSSAACTAAQACDTSACVRLTQCDASTGFDVASCGGACASKCALQGSYLERLNAGTCSTASDCNAARNETCVPISGRTCMRSSCNATTGAITTAACTGFCSSAAAPSLVSAHLADDGRRVLLRFDTAVYATSSSPSAIFDPATAAVLGTYSQVYSDWGSDTATLTVWLDYSASIAAGNLLTLAASPAITDRISGVAASPAASLCRAVSFAWAVTAAASNSTALQQLAASAAGASRLVLPASLAAALHPGTYTFSLTVTSWLGAADTASFSFTKETAALPVVAVVGGPQQTFSVASGIRVQTAIDLSSVCSGKRVTYQWAETSGKLPAGSFVANRSTLAIKGPIPSVTGGDALTFSLTATLEDAGSASASLTLTAQSSAVMAVLSGPRGDVRDTQALAFSGSSSLDPDDAANTITPFSFQWSCTALDASMQLSYPCFPNPATAPDLTAAQLTIPTGLLPASDSVLYTVALTAAKGSRSDGDTATLHVVSGPAPVGTLARFCPGAAGCTSKQHRPSEPLRLLFSLQDPSLLPHTAFAWASSDVSLPAGGKQSLVIQPYTAAGVPVFADGATITIHVTASADGKSATASLAVPIARRPACTAAAGASCLAASPASGPQDTTAFAATASGFAADSSLTYDWGTQDAAGRREYFARGTADAAFTFAPRVLPAGSATLFVCARDANGAQACSTTAVNVTAPAAAVSAADIANIADSLSTAVAAGSTHALLSAVRQLSAASAATGTDAGAAAAAAAQAEGAMGALQSALSGDGATVEESLGVAAAAASLVAASPTVTPALADSALNVAIAALQAVTSSGDAVQASDVETLVDIAATAGPALAAQEPASAGARRLLATANSTAPLAALAALTRMYEVVSASQAALLGSMVLGEAASVGSGNLTALAALVDPSSLGSAASYAVGASGAAVTLQAALGSLLAAADATPASIRLLPSHQADPSLLLAVVSASAAAVPSAAVGAASRALLAAAPAVTGALSTTLVSGYVNFTSSLDGLGTLASKAIDVAVPLTSAYDPLQTTTMCLRLDSTGYWRSDAIALAGTPAAGVAHCTLSNVNNQQVIVVQYMPDAAASPSPSPSPSPAADTVNVTVPQLSFTVHIAAYNPANFTASVQHQYMAALQAATSVNLLILLTNIRAGSVYVDTTVQFLVSNGNANAAKAMAATLTKRPATLLPAAAWGTVAVTGMVQGTATIAAPTSLLTAPVHKASKGGLIGGLVGGIGGALLLLAVVVCACKSRRPRRGSLESEMVPSQPTSPTSPQAFLQGGHASAHPF